MEGSPFLYLLVEGIRMLEIGEVLTLGANIGVIAGIVFLAMEVR
jgi:hypothetical protein